MKQSPKEGSNEGHVGLAQGMELPGCIPVPAPLLPGWSPVLSGQAAPKHCRLSTGRLQAGTGSIRHTDKAGLHRSRLIGVWCKTSY